MKIHKRENSTMVRSKMALLILSLFAFSQPSFSAPDILFEGFYKIMSKDQHIGYSVIRYQFDPIAKKFTTQQLTRMTVGKTDSMESLVAVADDGLHPISYKYTSLLEKQMKSIDAKFSKGKMIASLTESGKKAVSIRNDIKPDTFLSSFLVYTMLRSPTGIQTKTASSYDAIAEEDGKVEHGTATVLKEEKYKGFNAFKIENSFKNQKFISFITDKGEALVTEVPAAQITSELVAKPADAIGMIGMPEEIVRKIFGNIPTGSRNIVSQYFKSLENIAPGKGGKQVGFPQGQGVQIKPQPTTPDAPTKKPEDP